MLVHDSPGAVGSTRDGGKWPLFSCKPVTRDNYYVLLVASSTVLLLQGKALVLAPTIYNTVLLWGHASARTL
jgi:hypothetical protein